MEYTIAIGKVFCSHKKSVDMAELDSAFQDIQNYSLYIILIATYILLDSISLPIRKTTSQQWSSQ